MKISSPLDAILNNEAKVKILRFLFKTSAEWNGRQIAKEIGVSPATTHKALQGLYTEGVLLLRYMGKTHVYTLRQDTFIVSRLLKPLFSGEKKVRGCIIGIIRKKVMASRIKNSILSVALFGSVRAAKDHPASDIDILVVVKDTKVKAGAEVLFEEIDTRITREFGNTVSAYINTEAEFESKYRNKVTIARSIVKTNKLIYGAPIEKLL